MIIKSISIFNKKKAIIFVFLILIICIILCFTFFKVNLLDCIHDNKQNVISPDNLISQVPSEDDLAESSKKTSYIKWIDFKGTSAVLSKLAALDINSHVNNEPVKFNWIELMAYLGCKYGGNFAKFKQVDLDTLVSQLKSGASIENLSKDMKLYDYYYNSFDAIFHEYIGEYTIQVKNADGTKSYVTKYGLKAYLPIAQNYSFSHCKDFGTSRSYGYKRVHLGNDLIGSIGTPIIAVESGYVEALGWNQYGGWRVGIRSFDKKRYYYYAHLRKDHPYAKDLCEGQIVSAGDVIGYLGMTGYSVKENVNNINIPHLHFGVQIIFNEVQKDGINQIWIDVYQIIEFLRKNKSMVYVAYTDTKDFERVYDFMQCD